MKKHTLKSILQILFFIGFIWFSLKSLKSFYLGHVVYEIYKDSANEKVYFPAITLCPNPKINPLMNLKLDKFQKDKNITASELESFSVFGTLKAQYDLMNIIRNYSYTEEESFTTGKLNGNSLR